MRKNIKYFCIVIALISLAGCAGSPAWDSMQISSTRSEAEKNNANLMKVQIGQTKEELLSVMGQPTKREAYKLSDSKIVEFLFYRTTGWSSSNTGDRDAQFTPVAIESGKVSGWGRNYYDQVVRAAVDINVK